MRAKTGTPSWARQVDGEKISVWMSIARDRSRLMAVVLGLLITLMCQRGSADAAALDLFVTSVGTDSVIEYNGMTGSLVTQFVPPGSGGLVQPTGLVFGPNGDLFVSSQGTDSVLEYNGTNGTFVKSFVPAGTGGLDLPGSLGFGPNGNLFVISQGTASILEYDGISGTFVRTFVPTGSAHIPQDFVFGPNGNLFVSAATFIKNGGIFEYNGMTGNFIRVLAPEGSGGLDFPTGLGFGPNGNLFVASFGPPGKVLEYAPTTGALIGEFAMASGPVDLMFGPSSFFSDDSLFILTSFDGAVAEWRVCPPILQCQTGGVFFRELVQGGAELNSPHSFTFGPASASTTTLPEPSSWLLLVVGSAGLAAWRCIRRV